MSKYKVVYVEELGYIVVDERPYIPYIAVTGHNHTYDKASADTIVACLNACAGADDPAPGELARLREKNIRLRGALDGIAKSVPRLACECGWSGGESELLVDGVNGECGDNRSYGCPLCGSEDFYELDANEIARAALEEVEGE